jgi:hypothetical protein
MAVVSAAPTRAHAIDKRLKLMFKTAGYGAAGGLVIGAATAALGFGGFRNAFMGASAGMYAGIALAAYIIATPDENTDRPKKSHNPYAPRKPVGPDDYDDDTDMDDMRSMSPNRGSDNRPAGALDLASVERKVWTPLFSFAW